MTDTEASTDGHFDNAQAALDRLAAAAAARTRLAGRARAAAHGRAVRAANLALHAAMIRAHRCGVPAATIALTIGRTLKYTTTILYPDPTAVPHRCSPGPVIARHARRLNQALDAVATYGTAHPVTHRAIADAHAAGIDMVALGCALDVSVVWISRVVLAARSTRTPPS